jgi:lipopolysaccharide export system protein LptC
LITLLLVLAIGLSSWSILISKKKPSHKPVKPGTPDAYMENVVATIIDKTGVQVLRIESPKMTHYTQDDTTDITTPHITFFRQSPEPWHINSEYAKATQGIEQILFWNHVVIHHNEDIAAHTTTMKTESLTVFPSKKIASTQDAVLITQPDTTIHAIGMWANLNDGVVKLLTDTKGEYAPHS